MTLVTICLVSVSFHFFLVSHLAAFQLTLKSRCLSEEAQLGRIYSHGLMIARIHRQIADALYEDQKKGGDFETLWTMLPVDVRAHFIYRGFDNCSMATGGHAAHIRLKQVVNDR